MKREGGTRSHGLAGLAGGWDEEAFRPFESTVAPFEGIDAELRR